MFHKFIPGSVSENNISLDIKIKGLHRSVLLSERNLKYTMYCTFKIIKIANINLSGFYKREGGRSREGGLSLEVFLKTGVTVVHTVLDPYSYLPKVVYYDRWPLMRCKFNRKIEVIKMS